MTHLKLKFFILFLLGVVTSSLQAQTKKSTDDKVLAQLKNFRADYGKSLIGNKTETLEIYYADSVRLMPEFQKTIIGKSNALVYHKSFLERFSISSYSRNEIEILDLGSRIIEIGLFSMKGKLISTSVDHEINGKYLTVWKRHKENKLVLMSEAWNYNHHLPIENQLSFREVQTTDVALQAHLPINNPIRFELAALNKLMEATIDQHDPKLWSQFYTADGMFLYSRSPVYHGRKALDEFLEKHVLELPVFENLAIRNDQVEEIGNHVIEYASHIAIIRSGDFSGVFTGKDIRIWRREKGGSLKIFRHIAMYD